MVSLIPQMVQFTNQVVLALGNGVSPQVFSDYFGPQNTSYRSITAISVDANGVVTITVPGSGHQISTTYGPGGNLFLFGITNPAYNTNANGSSVFTILSVPDNTHVKIFNPSVIGQGASSGGQFIEMTLPVQSNFVPSYPIWTTAVAYAVNSIITPTVSNGYYYKAVQAGTSGGSQPSPWPTGTGSQIADGSVIWQNAGKLNTGAPPPPGCGHVCVYAGSVWMLNTWPSDTANGLDGPTCLRMCDVNNLNSWNPINQAFLDKDDGLDGMGLATFTITAQGIPPEGSLTAFKLYATYQIVGVFGSSNFAIQRAETDMGCSAPRTLQFAPGFGLMRQTRLGYAVFDGVTDRVVSQQIQPYLYASDDPDVADIIPADPSWMAIAHGSQTANPPMYITAIPLLGGTFQFQATVVSIRENVYPSGTIYLITVSSSLTVPSGSTVSYSGGSNTSLNGPYFVSQQLNNGVLLATGPSNPGGSQSLGGVITFGAPSNGILTRILCFDLVLKAWAVVDLPFPISTLAQARSEVSQVVTLMGSAVDGTLQRWQAADAQWATSGPASSVPAGVYWSVRTPTVASKDAYVRLYARRVIVRGQQNSSTMTINPRVAGIYQGAQLIAMPASGDIQVQAAIGVTHDRFDADISGQGQIVIDSVAFDVQGKPAGILAGAIS